MRQNRIKSWCLAALSWLLLSAPRSAAAEPSASERETARSLMDDADKLRDAGDPWGALEHYQAADQIMRVPTTALELARQHVAMLQLTEARAAALDAANMPPAKGEPVAYTKARAEAAQLAVELAPRVPDVTVFVEPDSVERRVSIDGLPIVRLPRPLPIRLNPGPHMLVVEAPGFALMSQQFALAEGEHARLLVVLQSEPVTVKQPAVQAPVVANDKSRTYDNSAAEAARMRGYVAVIAGSAVLAAGVVTGIVTANKTSLIGEECRGMRCPSSVRDDIDSANTLANVTNVALAVGVLGVAYGLFELWSGGSFSSEQAVTEREGVRVSVSVDQPGVQVRGQL